MVERVELLPQRDLISWLRWLRDHMLDLFIWEKGVDWPILETMEGIPVTLRESVEGLSWRFLKSGAEVPIEVVFWYLWEIIQSLESLCDLIVLSLHLNDWKQVLLVNMAFYLYSQVICLRYQGFQIIEILGYRLCFVVILSCEGHILEIFD